MLTLKQIANCYLSSKYLHEASETTAALTSVTHTHTHKPGEAGGLVIACFDYYSP